MDISVKENRTRTAFIIGAVGLFGIILTVEGTIRNTQNQGDLQRNIDQIQKTINTNQNSTVGLFGITSHGVQFIPFGTATDLQFDIVYTVAVNPAKNLRAYFDIEVANGPPSSDQDRAISKKFTRLFT